MNRSYRSFTRLCTPPDSAKSDRLARLPAWQAVLLCIGLFALTIPLAIVPSLSVRAAIGAGPFREPIGGAALGLSLVLATYLLVARMLDVPPRSLFLVRPSTATLGWVFVGLGLASTLTVLTVGVTEGDLDRMGLFPGPLLVRAVAGLAIGLWTATLEELLLRGAVLSIIGHQWNWPGAVLVTSVLFGIFHHAHADTLLGVGHYVVLTGLAGVLFGLVTVWTGNVWNAVAIHGAWNGVFHEHVVRFGSAGTVEPIFAYRISGDVWLAGGRHAAPTESVLAIGLFLCTTAIVAWHRYGRLDHNP